MLNYLGVALLAAIGSSTRFQYFYNTCFDRSFLFPCFFAVFLYFFNCKEFYRVFISYPTDP